MTEYKKRCKYCGYEDDACNFFGGNICQDCANEFYVLKEKVKNDN
jgi:hypothetical protein